MAILPRRSQLPPLKRRSIVSRQNELLTRSWRAWIGAIAFVVMPWVDEAAKPYLVRVSVRYQLSIVSIASIGMIAVVSPGRARLLSPRSD